MGRDSDLYADSVSVFLGAPAVQGYDYRGELGRGGMGVVLQAFDSRLNRDVAIKLICDSDASEIVRARFQREAVTLARLEHHHIARVFDYGEESGMPYLVMEHIQGKTLRALLRESLRVEHRVPDFEWTVQVFLKLAEALQYCHGQGILHRDIKPDNIMIETQRNRPVIIDFGLIGKIDGRTRMAQVSEEVPVGFSESLSKSGVICGTWQYMSPEQLSGKDRECPLTEAADVWGFGGTLYYCLTGCEPYEAENDVAFFAARGKGPPQPVRARNPEIPRWLGRLCDRCFEVDPERRPDLSTLIRALGKDPSSRNLRRPILLLL